MGGITRNYIVRIYRWKKNSPRSLVGVVEEPEKGEKHAFTNLDELWRILNPRRNIKVTKGGESQGISEKVEMTKNAKETF